VSPVISGVASYGALGHVPPPPPSTSNNFIFSSLWSKSDRQLSKYCVVCEIAWCRMQMSTTRSSFDQYCISHKTISHREAAAPGPEVRRECTITYFSAMPLLATNPGDATACHAFM